MADVCVRRRHEVHDRRLAGRLRDDGPDGPLCPRGDPAPPGCVPRRSLVLLRSGPLRCRESVLKRSLGHAPGRDRRGSLRRATATAMTPHAREPERLLQSRARLRPGTMGQKGRLSPRGRDHVVVHVVEEPGYRALSETLSRRPEPTTSSGPTRHTTTPPAREDSTVRGLEGSQGEPGATWRRAGCRRGDLVQNSTAVRWNRPLATGSLTTEFPAQVAIPLSSPVDMARSFEAPIIGKPGASEPQPGRSALPSWYNSTPHLAALGVPSPAAHVHRLPMASPAARIACSDRTPVSWPTWRPGTQSLDPAGCRPR